MIVKTRTNVYDFNFHLVWVTKYRKEIFTTIEKQNAMQDILTHICDEHDIVIQSLQVMPDHIHMLISFNPKHAASNIVKTLKGKSLPVYGSKLIQKQRQCYGVAIYGHLVISCQQ